MNITQKLGKKAVAGWAQKKLLVIPLFIPHEGCPHCCSFCNQHQISGQDREPITATTVDQVIEDWLGRSGDRYSQVQVAFYGGSFTGLPLERQRSLLSAVQPYLQAGRVQEIRLSTRPDYIDSERLDLLKEYGVGVVELGVQSLDDQVLRLAGRGHSAEATLEAAQLIKSSLLKLGVQLMVGLPGQSFASLRRTLSQVIVLEPDLVRLYPVLVLRGSGLELLFNQGRFQPISLHKAVLQAAFMKKRFDDHGIRVVRMGLQPGPELENSLVTGPYHPAFGEMVKARMMFNATRRLLASASLEKPVVLVINNRDQSVFRGLRSANMKRLRQLDLLERFTLQTDPNQPRGTVRLAG